MLKLDFFFFKYVFLLLVGCIFCFPQMMGDLKKKNPILKWNFKCPLEVIVYVKVTTRGWFYGNKTVELKLNLLLFFFSYSKYNISCFNKIFLMIFGWKFNFDPQTWQSQIFVRNIFVWTPSVITVTVSCYVLDKTGKKLSIYYICTVRLTLFVSR